MVLGGGAGGGESLAGEEISGGDPLLPGFPRRKDTGLRLSPAGPEHALDGFLYFLEEISARAFIPMHYWDAASDAKAYLSDPRLSPWLDKIHFLKKTEEFDLQ